MKANLCLINRAQQGKQVMSRGIAHQDEVVRSVLVVAGCIQRHHALQECLRSLQHHTDRLSDTHARTNARTHVLDFWLE